MITKVREIKILYIYSHCSALPLKAKEQTELAPKDQPAQQAQSSITAAKPSQKAPKLPPATVESNRPPLTEDVFLLEVLSWQVKWLNQNKGFPVKKYNMKRIPWSFNSIDEYHDILKPLVLTETWEEVRHPPSLVPELIYFVWSVAEMKSSERKEV